MVNALSVYVCLIRTTKALLNNCSMLLHNLLQEHLFRSECFFFLFLSIFRCFSLCRSLRLFGSPFSARFAIWNVTVCVRARCFVSNRISLIEIVANTRHHISQQQRRSEQQKKKIYLKFFTLLTRIWFVRCVITCAEEIELLAAVLASVFTMPISKMKNRKNKNRMQHFVWKGARQNFRVFFFSSFN